MQQQLQLQMQQQYEAQIQAYLDQIKAQYNLSG
jgi:hypothetical protein